jgi:hypothetical protein
MKTTRRASIYGIVYWDLHGESILAVVPHLWGSVLRRKYYALFCIPILYCHTSASAMASMYLPKFVIENLILSVAVLRVGTFQQWWGHEGSVLMNGVCVNAVIVGVH